MSKRKYSYYTLNADLGEINETIQSYRDAFSKYHRVENPKTLYGVDEQGKVEVIFSEP